MGEIPGPVDVEEGIDGHAANLNVGKENFDCPMLGDPFAGLALTRFQRGGERGREVHGPKPDHRMGADIRPRHEQFGVVPLLAEEAPHQIQRKEGRVGREGDGMGNAGAVRPDPFKSGMHASQGAGNKPRVIETWSVPADAVRK